MRLVTAEQLEALIRTARLRVMDDRLTAYTREQAQENVAALEELKVHRRGIVVEGAVGKRESVSPCAAPGPGLVSTSTSTTQPKRQ